MPRCTSSSSLPDQRARPLARGSEFREHRLQLAPPRLGDGRGEPAQQSSRASARPEVQHATVRVRSVVGGDPVPRAAETGGDRRGTRQAFTLGSRRPAGCDGSAEPTSCRTRERLIQIDDMIGGAAPSSFPVVRMKRPVIYRQRFPDVPATRRSALRDEPSPSYRRRRNQTRNMLQLIAASPTATANLSHHDIGEKTIRAYAG